MKDIIVVGYHSTTGNFVPCTFFQSQSDFESWITETKLLENNLSLYKFKVSSFDSLSPQLKEYVIDVLKNPLV